MDVEIVKKEMDELERNWFAAHRTAIAAQQELAGRLALGVGASILWGLLGGIVAAGLGRVVSQRLRRKLKLQTAQARLEEADRRKQEIMRKIEALEDSLLA